MPDVVNASDVVLFCEVEEEYIAIGCATSVNFEFVNELIGKTDVNAGLFRKKRVRISTCSGSIQGLLTLYNTINHLSSLYFLQEGIRRSEQALKFLYTDQGGIARQITGNFLVETVSITAQTSPDFAEFDINFQGTGSITISTLDSPPDPTCFEAFSDWWVAPLDGNSITGTGMAGKSFANQEIIEVVREAGPPLSFTSGTPGDREYAFDGTTITTWADNPYVSGERIFVIWQEIV